MKVETIRVIATDTMEKTPLQFTVQRHKCSGVFRLISCFLLQTYKTPVENMVNECEKYTICM